MNEPLYTFNGKDITMNMCIQIRDTIRIIMEHTRLSFPDAAAAFYNSSTYTILQNTENTLWAESAGYIADYFFKEQNTEHLSPASRP